MVLFKIKDSDNSKSEKVSYKEFFEHKKTHDEYQKKALNERNEARKNERMRIIADVLNAKGF